MLYKLLVCICMLQSLCHGRYLNLSPQSDHPNKLQYGSIQNIVIPEAIVDDFLYIPTLQGYRFSYELANGLKREEISFINGPRIDEYTQYDSRNTDFTAVGVGGRPKMKVRKLSPKSLQSLAG